MGKVDRLQGAGRICCKTLRGRNRKLPVGGHGTSEVAEIRTGCLSPCKLHSMTPWSWGFIAIRGYHQAGISENVATYDHVPVRVERAVVGKDGGSREGRRVDRGGYAIVGEVSGGLEGSRVDQGLCDGRRR